MEHHGTQGAVTDGSMSPSDYAWVLGIIILKFSFIIALVHWSDEFISTLVSIPNLLYNLSFAAWILASVYALSRDNENIHYMGFVGLLVLGFAAGLVLAFEMGEIIATGGEHILTES